MKKIRLIMCLTMALTILMGSVLSVSASEIDENEVEENVVADANKYYFDGYEYNEKGEIIVKYISVQTGFAHGYYDELRRSATFTYDATLKPFVYVNEATGVANIVHFAYENSDKLSCDYKLHEQQVEVYLNDDYIRTDIQNTRGFSWENSVVSCNIPIFMSLESARAWANTGDDSGIVNKPPLTDEEMVFNSDIPTPILVFDNDGGLGFQFNNASEDFYIEMKGRWWSVDDITLFKKNLMWKYSYESLIKNDLSTWISNISCVSSENEHDLSDYGKESFENLLTLYPVDERNYSGGSNAFGNYFSGYNDAMTTLKMLLNEKTSSYNGCEVYVRYYTIDNNGNYYYGKWCHWLGNLANQEESSGSVLDDENIYKGQQSESGITDDDMEIIESSGNSRNDPDLKEEIYGEYESPITGISSSEFSAYFKQAIDIIKGLGGMLGEFPSLVGQIASYLPPWVIACMGVGIVFVIILRIVGR